MKETTPGAPPFYLGQGTSAELHRSSLRLARRIDPDVDLESGGRSRESSGESLRPASTLSAGNSNISVDVNDDDSATQVPNIRLHHSRSLEVPPDYQNTISPDLGRTRRNPRLANSCVNFLV
ncbi:unnamed protein product, partial [Mesorhabditis spiculigera]